MRKREPGRRTGPARARALAAAGGAMMLALGGCGQSGPLYLPEKSSPSAAAPARAPAPGSVPSVAAGRPGAVRAVPDRLAHG